MKTIGITVMMVLGLMAARTAEAQCTCSVAKVKNGWCTDCKVGYFDALKIKSQKLFAVLAGEPADAHEFTCASCKRAKTDSGYCEACGIGFANGRHYHSKVVYLLAKGETKDPEQITCEACRKNAAGSGWCDSCNIGLVGNAAFKDRQAYEQAAEARQVVLAASESKCEACAVAMLTDGECKACKVAYKNGKKTKLEP